MAIFLSTQPTSNGLQPNCDGLQPLNRQGSKPRRPFDLSWHGHRLFFTFCLQDRKPLLERPAALPLRAQEATDKIIRRMIEEPKGLDQDLLKAGHQTLTHALFSGGWV